MWILAPCADSVDDVGDSVTGLFGEMDGLTGWILWGAIGDWSPLGGAPMLAELVLFCFALCSGVWYLGMFHLGSLGARLSFGWIQIEYRSWFTGLFGDVGGATGVLGADEWRCGFGGVLKLLSGDAIAWCCCIK